MSGLIAGLYEDWISLDERIDTIAREIEMISEKEANCQRLMSVPGIGPLISTAVVAAIGAGEAFERGRDFGAWLGLVPRQYSTEEARGRGARRIWVASYDFQAPGMYEKAGFKRVTEFEGWPDGHVNVVLCKTL